MIKVVVFDYGGVIGKNPNAHIHSAISRKFKISEKKLKKELYNLLPSITKGELSEKIFWKKLAKRLKIADFTILRKAWLTEYKKRAKINKNVLGLAIKLKKNYRLCLLSNNAIFYQKKSITKILKRVFNVIVYSYKAKMIKPKKGIYLYALEKLKVEANECLIIDDNKRALFYPKKMGMKTIQFTGMPEFKKILEKKLENKQQIKPRQQIQKDMIKSLKNKTKIGEEA